MRNYGFVLLDSSMHIVEAKAQATYEDTLDGKLQAATQGLVYVPLNLVELVDELSKVEIY